MTDEIKTAVADAKAAVDNVVATVKTDVAADVVVVKKTWTQKILPWLTHAGAVVLGFLSAKLPFLASFL